MPSITLFTQNMNPFTEKVACALAFKDLAYQRVEVTEADEIKRLNPEKQTLPVLEVDREQIQDSPNILRWLEDRHPEPSLFSNDLKTRKQQESLADWSDSSFAFYWNRWLKANEEYERNLSTSSPGLLTRIHQHVGERIGIETNESVENDPGVKKILQELSNRMDDLVGFLAGRPFFFSDQLSVADLSVFGMLLVMRHGPMPTSASLLSSRPSLAAHTDRMTEITLQGTGARDFIFK